MRVPANTGRQKVEPVVALFWMLCKTDAVWAPPPLGSASSCTQAIPRVAEFSESYQGPLHQHSPACCSHWQWQAEGQALTSVSLPQCNTSRRDETGQTGDHTSAGCAVVLIKHLQCNPSWVSRIPTLTTPEKARYKSKHLLSGFLMWHHYASHFSAVCVWIFNNEYVLWVCEQKN